MIEVRDAWRQCEARYVKVIEAYLDEANPQEADKGAALAITKARVKADKRLDVYLHRCLG